MDQEEETSNNQGEYLDLYEFTDEEMRMILGETPNESNLVLYPRINSTT